MIETKEISWDKVGKLYELTKGAQFNVDIKPKQTVTFGNAVLTKHGELLLFRGVRWDGASGPAIDTKTNMRASLVHDILILMVQSGKLPRDAITKFKIDREYARLALEDGMFPLRIALHYMVIKWNQWQNKIFKRSWR